MIDLGENDVIKGGRQITFLFLKEYFYAQIREKYLTNVMWLLCVFIALPLFSYVNETNLVELFTILSGTNVCVPVKA